MQTFAEFQGQPNNAVAHQGPLTVADTAVTLASLLTAAAIHSDTRFVQITVEDAPLRYTVTGTTPTSTLGHKVNPEAGVVTLSKAEAENCRLIRSTSISAKIQVAQYIN